MVQTTQNLQPEAGAQQAGVYSRGLLVAMQADAQRIDFEITFLLINVN